IDPPTPRTHLVELRFDSQPSGRVFAEGSAAELCQTPCAFDIDLADGGPADHRAFVVRRAGYVDSPITVDLTGSQREFQVTLSRAAPEGRDTRDARPEAKAASGRPDGDRRTTRRPARTRKDKDAASRPPRDAEPHDTEPSEPEPRPTATKPAATNPVPAIDPADTLDPFRKK
ncbi:MAG TPA: hypothetical protein VF469_39750, partial [Kofleriaceae bacterium]